jgi:hypothetical protein
MVIIERLLQPAASAISEVVSDLLSIISRIITCWEAASRGAMIVFVVLSTKVAEVVKGARKRDESGSGSVRADSPADKPIPYPRDGLCQCSLAYRTVQCMIL